jgi:hypothetical protein
VEQAADVIARGLSASCRLCRASLGEALRQIYSLGAILKHVGPDALIWAGERSSPVMARKAELRSHAPVRASAPTLIPLHI